MEPQTLFLPETNSSILINCEPTHELEENYNDNGYLIPSLRYLAKRIHWSALSKAT